MSGEAPGTPLELSVPGWRLAVCRLGPEEEVPAWAVEAPFFSVTRSPEELSVVCPEDLVPDGIRREGGWRVLKVEGPLDFGQTGILSSLLGPLSGVGVFVLSTYETDYVLVKEDQLGRAVSALVREGHIVRR
ncbi:amino acid-binding protein [Rubrobacter xylanophilus]|uniref:Amino acid-binding protein n=1 Tax=Rubrobacter xylanophilus TaxID=49319 RepID=A0A510HLF6_9ACTN|nr:ACT domain-containing protein [Rubrobacter xylanophilus]BBL80175.1 amino acid-binding protein [Rubrobacter xylanophilus]